MLVEHTFITTLESEPALAEAVALLQGGGFTIDAPMASAVSSSAAVRQPDHLELIRGKKRPKDPTDSPQRIRLEWDRGRMNVAADIRPGNRGNSFLMGGRNEALTRNKRTSRTAPYIDLMIAISQSLEDRLGRQQSADQAAAAWTQMETELRERFRKKRRRSLILFLLAVLFVIAVPIAMYLIYGR